MTRANNSSRRGYNIVTLALEGGQAASGVP